MFKNILILIAGFGLAVAGCDSTKTSSDSGGFFEMGTPRAFNKMGADEEKTAHRVITMIEQTLSSVSEQELAKELSMKSYLQTSTGPSVDFRNKISNVCVFHQKQESSSDNQSTVVSRWEDDKQKSDRNLDKEKGEKLIPCPVSLRGTSNSMRGARTKLGETVTFADGGLELNIGELEQLDTQNSTSKQVVYKGVEISPVLALSVSFSSQQTQRPSKGYRSPGRGVNTGDQSWSIVYMDGDVRRRATVERKDRMMIRTKKVSESTSLTFGRKVSALIVKMHEGTVTVETGEIYRGDKGTDTYVRLNGKLIEENGRRL